MRTGQGGWRHFVVAVVLPLAITVAMAPVLALTDRGSGLNGATGEWAALVTGCMVIGGWVATLVAVVRAATHRFPSEQPRYGRLPLTVAVAAMAGAVASNVANLDLGFLILVAVVCSALGGIAGWHTAAVMLTPARLPTSDTPAPSDAARHCLNDGETAVWVGRAPPLPLLTWLGPILVVAAAACVLAPEVLPWGVVAGWSALWIVGHALGRSQRRVRVVIGRSGLRILGGAHRWERRAVPLEHIVSASCTTLNRWWGTLASLHSGRHRLTIATRPGPAMLVELTDGSEVVVSLGDPSEAVAVLNSLLDNRGAVSAAGRT